jgi:hypothetical protein
MQTIKSRVSRQATSLLDIAFWSNLVVIAIVIVINVINLCRSAAQDERLIAIASPELVVIASALLCVWMAVRAISALLTKRRLRSVYICVTQDGIEGVSMPEPMSGRKGVPFSLPFREITELHKVETPIARRSTVPSLRIGNSEVSYTVPAPEQMEELMVLISDQMSSVSE